MNGMRWPDPETPKKTQQLILIFGNPVDGFTYVGPFKDSEELTDYAQSSRNISGTTWWAATLEPQCQCDCSGCDVCGSHCVPSCSSGEGVRCAAEAGPWSLSRGCFD